MMEQQNSMTQACSYRKALSTILLAFWLLGAAVAQKAPGDFNSKKLPRVFCLSPVKLARTKSLGYSTMNLDGLFRLAAMGQKAGVDLWHYESADGRSLRKALDYLAPYADPQKAWPHEQITESSPTGLFALLRRGSIVYGDERYEMLIEKTRRRKWPGTERTCCGPVTEKAH